MTANAHDLAANGYVTEAGFLDELAAAALQADLERAARRDTSSNPLSVGAMRFKSNLFRESSGLRRFVCSGRVVSFLNEHAGTDMWARWDQAVWKHPGAPQFPWHQDNGYTGLETEHFQLWLALTPMDATNGGLVIAPGEHRRVAPHEWEGGHATMEPPPQQLLITAERGDAVLFSSRLPHSTVPNTSSRSRLAYVVEFLPLDAADDSVEPPHFVVSRGGHPVGRFEDLRPRWPSPR